MSADGLSMTATDVSVRLDGRPIVSGVNVEVASGEIVGLVGPNGSGKSTLLRALTGILPLACGDVRLGQESLTKMNSRRRARAVAFVGQEDQPQSDLLVHEYVALGRTPHARPWSVGGAREATAIDDALARVGLTEHRFSSVDSLSGGERRRVVLARGLAQCAGILVLDEPTNHLDIRHQLELLDLVRSLHCTVVMALHDLDLAAAVCDRVLVMDHGQVGAFGSAAEVLNTDVLARVFGVEAFELLNPATGRSHLVFETALPSEKAS